MLYLANKNTPDFLLPAYPNLQFKINMSIIFSSNFYAVTIHTYDAASNSILLSYNTPSMLL